MPRFLLYALCSLLLTGLWSCDQYGALSSTNAYYADGSGNERYNSYEENPFVETEKQAVSTFSIDCDGAAYSNMRRFLSNGQQPPKDAIRTEELINYFQYHYDEPTGTPIGVSGEVCACPWNTAHKLVRIGVKGKSIPDEQLAASNIVLLLDVSGSMMDENKLPLVKQGLIRYFVPRLREQDKVAIITYAGSNTLVLGATSGAEKSRIESAINKLNAGGSTAGAQGIITAYQIAGENFVEGGNNRVILVTDGDFNVGPSSQSELVSLIEEKRKTGIFLSVIGVGTGNLNDGMMEQVADKGNGIYEYMDNLRQAEKIFKDEYNKFYTVAKDVKIQVEFNPALVKSYRLIGYENRMLDSAAFSNDSTDAGDISAGQTITALYEIEPNLSEKYESMLLGFPTFSIDFRYKEAGGSSSQSLRLDIRDSKLKFSEATEDTRFAAAVAAFGMYLRGSQHKGSANKTLIQEWAGNATGFDPNGYRREFLDLIAKAK